MDSVAQPRQCPNRKRSGVVPAAMKSIISSYALVALIVSVQHLGGPSLSPNSSSIPPNLIAIGPPVGTSLVFGLARHASANRRSDLNSPPIYPPTGVFLVSKSNYFTKIFAL